MLSVWASNGPSLLLLPPTPLACCCCWSCRRCRCRCHCRGRRPSCVASAEESRSTVEVVGGGRTPLLRAVPVEEGAWLVQKIEGGGEEMGCCCRAWPAAGLACRQTRRKKEGRRRRREKERVRVKEKEQKTNEREGEVEVGEDRSRIGGERKEKSMRERTKRGGWGGGTRQAAVERAGVEPPPPPQPPPGV